MKLKSHNQEISNCIYGPDMFYLLTQKISDFLDFKVETRQINSGMGEFDSGPKIHSVEKLAINTYLMRFLVI